MVSAMLRFLAAVAAALTLAACSSSSSSSGVRPETPARIEIVQPSPNQTLPPTFPVTVNLIGAKVVPAQVSGGTLKPDEGHIHIILDGKVIDTAAGTTREMTNLPPGPHTIQAEFVAADHAPFRNRVVAAVAVDVAASPPPS